MLHFLENEDSYDSTTSSTATASSTSTQPSRAVRKGSRKYYFSTTHDSYDDAVRVVEQEKMWRKSNMTKTTQYYLCNRVITNNNILRLLNTSVCNNILIMNIHFGLITQWIVP